MKKKGSPRTPLQRKESFLIFRIGKAPKEINPKNIRILIPNAVERKPNHFYVIDSLKLNGDIIEYKNFSWKHFTFKQILQCIWIDIKRGLML